MNEIRNFLLSPEEYLDTFWESDALIWVDWREYDESIIKYINERLPEEDKVKFTCVEIEKERDVDIILEKSSQTYSQVEKEEFANKKNTLYQQYLKQMTPSDLSVEVKETLDQLRNKGYRLAIGSSSKNTKLILKQLGLENYFDAICDGTMIQYSKPHPEVFMKAADLLEKNYKNCLVVEDALAGCIAAKSASMHVAAISSAYGSPYADYHLNTFKDLLEINNK